MADDEIKVKKERDPIMAVSFVVFLLAVCAVSGASIYDNYLKADDTLAVNGSTVSVNYTGTYYDFYGSDNGVVFDTSIWSIANDNGVLKSNDFTLKSESSYVPLKFTVGGTTVIKAFGDAVIGHKVGEKIQVKIPVGEGYNAPYTSVTKSASAAVSIPASETMTSAQFEILYGHALKGYEEIEKSVYGWPASASYNTVGNTVTVAYHPAVGQTYTAVDNDFGKVSFRVASVGSTISFTYLISDYTVVSQAGADKEIQMIMMDFGTEKFYITSVTDTNNDGIADTFTYKTVSERNNQILYFEIEIVEFN